MLLCLSRIFCNSLLLFKNSLNLREISSYHIFMISPCSTLIFALILSTISFYLNFASTAINLWLDIRHIISLKRVRSISIYKLIFVNSRFLLNTQFLSLNRNLCLIVYLWCIFLERSKGSEYRLFVFYFILPSLQDTIQQIFIKFSQLLCCEASNFPLDFT